MERGWTSQHGRFWLPAFLINKAKGEMK